MTMTPLTITLTPMYLLIAIIIGLILLFIAYKFGKHVGELTERADHLETIKEDGIEWEDFEN